MDLNVLLPGNRAEASTDNGTKNEGEQKSKSHHWEDVLCATFQVVSATKNTAQLVYLDKVPIIEVVRSSQLNGHLKLRMKN